MRVSLVVAAAVFLSVAAIPVPDKDLEIKGPLGIDVDTGDDLSDLGEISPIEDGFLEGDVDTGGGGDEGETAGGVANGALGGGSVSGSVTNGTQGSTSSQCSLLVCTSAAQSSNQNSSSTSTTTSGALINGPLVDGPLVSIGRRLMRRLRSALDLA